MTGFACPPTRYRPDGGHDASASLPTLQRWIIRMRGDDSQSFSTMMRSSLRAQAKQSRAAQHGPSLRRDRAREPPSCAQSNAACQTACAALTMPRHGIARLALA
jgi:hypothetical protein